MSVSNRRGFVPIRHQSGGRIARSKLYPTNANLIATIAAGDAVCLVNGFVQRWTTANVAKYLGVVDSVYDSNRRPATFSLPTKSAYINASTAGLVAVIDDPHVTFMVECAASIGPSDIGKLAQIEVSAVNTATGYSGMFVASVTAADAGNDSCNHRVIGLAPSEIAVTAVGSPNNKIEVITILGLMR